MAPVNLVVHIFSFISFFLYREIKQIKSDSLELTLTKQCSLSRMLLG